MKLFRKVLDLEVIGDLLGSEGLVISSKLTLKRTTMFTSQERWKHVLLITNKELNG